jgi:transposase
MAEENKPPPNPDDGTRGPGRPTKLTQEAIDAAVILLLDGNYRADVAKAIGVSFKTFRHWMNNGRNHPEGIYGQFRKAVHSAEAQFKTRAVGSIVSAGNDDPWLLLAILERKYPKQWGKYRGELGELKRRVREMEKVIEEMERLVESSDSQPV